MRGAEIAVFATGGMRAFGAQVFLRIVDFIGRASIRGGFRSRLLRSINSSIAQYYVDIDRAIISHTMSTSREGGDRKQGWEQSANRGYGAA